MTSTLEIEPLPHVPFPKEDIPDTMTRGMFKSICPGELTTVKAKLMNVNEPKRMKT